MFYYVNNTGSDTNDGSIGSPFLTIAYAIGQASNGDTITIQNEITISTTINVTKELTITGDKISKTTSGDLILIQSNNVTITGLTLQCNATNTADAVINIDRGSSGTTLPANYSNITISNNTFNIYKYGIITNGTNIVISSNQFTRQSGTERLSIILIYQINNLSVTNNTVTDILRTQRFLYFTSVGTSGSTYFNECNYKTGLITISNNTCNCSSTAQSLLFYIQDSFIGSNLVYNIIGNVVNVAIAAKMFVSYISTNNDLSIYSEVTIHDNSINNTTSGIVHIDSPVNVTITVSSTIFYVYNNTSTFVLDPARTGNSSFTQTTATVSPTNLYLSLIISYQSHGGGDPHIVSINGIKTTLPNDWNLFILYKSNKYTILAKAEFLPSLNLHFINNGAITTINQYHTWVKDYTYITEVTIIYNDKKLIIDTLNGNIIYDNSPIIYTKKSIPLWSITHKKEYPPTNLKSYEIDIGDIINISVDNYWDDINYITLKILEGLQDKSGELICHNINNKINT